MSDSVQPQRQQPIRLPHPWDSPGKNTGVGCHFLLQCMKVKSESKVAQLCPSLSDPMDCSLPGSSVHGIFQVRVGCHCLLHEVIIIGLLYYTSIGMFIWVHSFFSVGKVAMVCHTKRLFLSDFPYSLCSLFIFLSY